MNGRTYSLKSPPNDRFFGETLHGNFICYQSFTYIPSARIIDLVTYITYVVCVSFLQKWQDLQFKVNSDQQIFWETLHGNFIYFS